MRRADRLMKIVHFMRHRRRAVTAQRIADEFEICTRTVYRDIQDLMDSGVPIQGEAGVGYIIDKQYYLPPVTFDIDELEAISLGISMVRQCTDEKFTTKANTALDKIQAVLPKNLQGELEQVTTYSLPGQPITPWQIDFSELRECIRNRRKVVIDYCDDVNIITSRTIRPLALVFFNPVWVLASWCEKCEDFRHFRLDRIQALEQNDMQFADEDDKNLGAYRLKEAACHTE